MAPNLSTAGLSLGLGDAPETEDERRKRLMAVQQQQQRLLPSAALSPAGMSLGLG
jgi:hypothetical protein